MTRIAATPLSIAIGELLTRYRQLKKWDIVTLSRRTGLNPSHLSNLENGHNTPSIGTLFLFGEVLGFRPSDMLRAVEERLGRK